MLIDDIALTLQPNIGPKSAIHLIERFGSAGELFSLPAAEIAKRAGINRKMAEALAGKSYHGQAEREIRFLQKYNIHAFISTALEYPPLLRECADYPHVLYVKGDPALLQRRTIAFTGTRNITSYGSKMCKTLITRLGELLPGVAIVSGLSYGAEVACHQAALAAGIPSIAVLSHGLKTIYPARHTDIARDIVYSGGVLLTEFHSTYTPTNAIFLQRNRIVAGLTEGTVIIESPADGGSLTTAELAFGYHRCVMAVPGRATDKSSEGTNDLIKGLKARMVCSAEDILQELNWESAAKRPAGGAKATGDLQSSTQKARPPIGKDEEGLLGCFRDQYIATADELSEESGLSLSALAPLLLNLEMAGRVRLLPGNRYELL